ncbi:MAG TPA: hypothetical protein VKO18_01020, partial [Terriglobia bacterium]|nr:hypothetical protein [Terriglobia bacterium]
ASCLLHAIRVESAPGPDAIVTKIGGTVQARGKDYTWEWTEANDDFRLLDSRGLVIASGKLQPAVMVQATGEGGVRRCSAGKPAGYDVRGNAVSVRYEGVNGSAKVSLNWRFQDGGMWLDPIVYESPSTEDVVSLHYFAQADGNEAQPSLQSDYLVVPGANESPALSPILPQNAFTGLKETLWLGHGGANPETQGGQQWALPVHYFCGFHMSPYDFQKAPHLTAVQGVELDQLLDAFCCGLAEIPNGDLLIETQDGKYSQVVNYRGDLWGHVRGPGKLVLGAKQYWTVGPNYYEAIRRYYLGLLAAGAVRKKTNSARKLDVALAPSFCTYGEQYAREHTDERLDEPTLLSIYEEMGRSGMKAKLFVIDAKWEGKWGNLRHSEERLPHFEDILARIRSDGHYVGLWAAFLRCADPGDLGLKTEHVLHQPDGKPYVINNITPDPYYMYDASQPQVQQALKKLAKEFVRRYKPDFVKFDFGYEIPAMAIAAPKDKAWAGERYLSNTLELIVNAMREENPDLVMLYYSLSPLLLEHIDLHSPDDLGLCLGDFGLEANRRLFFSSLLGEIGMPTWGSSGYDWVTAPDVWFDTAALGALGSLLSFSGPQAEKYCKPERVAKFNGLAQAVRLSDTFSTVPIDAAYLGPERGAHASSWARIENGEVVLVALRERCLDGRKGSGKFRDLVTSNTSMVVASKTNDGLAHASKLAVVPYGDGEITLQRADNGTTRAEATEHYFGGGRKTTQLPVAHGRLQIPLREHAEDGSVVEWIEISFFAN